MAGSDGVTVALDLALDEELEREGRVYELVHSVNTMRKEAGLELTDRIRLTIPESDADLLEHSEWIARETLAVSVEADGAELAIAEASPPRPQSPATKKTQSPSGSIPARQPR